MRRCALVLPPRGLVPPLGPFLRRKALVVTCSDPETWPRVRRRWPSPRRAKTPPVPVVPEPLVCSRATPAWENRRNGRRIGVTATVCAVLVGAAALPATAYSAAAPPPSGRQVAPSGTYTFDYTGTPQTLAGVPAGAIVTVTADGAGGGSCFAGTGGTGARVTTTLRTASVTTYTIRVGGTGQRCIFGPEGGFNGGGSSGGGSGGPRGSSGGGASSVTAGTTLQVVAGGGGGSGGGVAAAVRAGAADSRTVGPEAPEPARPPARAVAAV